MSDYNLVEVADRCVVTGYPRDKYGLLLDPDSGPEDGWKNGWKGMKLKELTSPYGSLEFAVGSGDDFYCFDYALVKGIGINRGHWLVLHSVINSETGHFIDRGDYQIISMMDYDDDALSFVSAALDWCQTNDIKHTKRGWNQDPFYFVRCVRNAVRHHYHRTGQTNSSSPLKEWSNHAKRFGGKRIDGGVTLWQGGVK